MYSPKTDEGEAEKSEVDDDDDDEDDDSDGSVVNIAFQYQLRLPPPLIVSPLKADPLLGGGVAVFGTPPFLERRQARGGDKLVGLSMMHSNELQQPRPARDNFPVPPPGTKLLKGKSKKAWYVYLFIRYLLLWGNLAYSLRNFIQGRAERADDEFNGCETDEAHR
jgi:hypothetical protein